MSTAGPRPRIAQRLTYRWTARKQGRLSWRWMLVGREENGVEYTLGKGHAMTRLGCRLAAERSRRTFMATRKPTKRAGGWLR